MKLGKPAKKRVSRVRSMRMKQAVMKTMTMTQKKKRKETMTIRM